MTTGGTTVNFTYRADGLRARKQVVGGLTIDYVYDGQTVVGETRSDGTSSWYTPGPNGYISRTDLNSQGNVTNKEWFVYDGLGSCRAMVKPNAQGTEAVLVARYDYDVYGAVRTQSGSSANQFKYVASIGHPTDEETGLIYMRARYYDAGTGRFVSEDPAGHGMNWYGYVDANPTNAVDPSGNKTLTQRVLLQAFYSFGLALITSGFARAIRGGTLFYEGYRVLASDTEFLIPATAYSPLLQQLAMLIPIYDAISKMRRGTSMIVGAIHSIVTGAWLMYATAFIENELESQGHNLDSEGVGW